MAVDLNPTIPTETREDVTDAIRLLVSILHDPELDIDADNREGLYRAIGILEEYELDGD